MVCVIQMWAWPPSCSWFLASTSRPLLRERLKPTGVEASGHKPQRREDKKGGKSLHARYVSTVSGPGADTDRLHCIWAEIQQVQYVLYLIVSEVEADTDCIHRIIQ